MSVIEIAELTATLTLSDRNFTSGVRRARLELQDFEGGAKKAGRANEYLSQTFAVLSGNVLTRVTQGLMHAG